MALPIQLVLPAQSPEGRIVALVLLVVFFLLAIAAVPFEFSFYSSLRRQKLLPSILAEIAVFIIIVLLLAGVMLDWFLSLQGLWMLVVLLALLVTLLLYFLYWRMRLISSLFARADKLAKPDLDNLLEEMRKVDEKKQRGDANNGEGDVNG